ncbi:MAG: AhpC/TSA family protein [Bacteroidales bacterium]|jgi:peroxiredoxin|nr:AhpC/TSA family protein [Bacteroidales bacterium]
MKHLLSIICITLSMFTYAQNVSIAGKINNYSGNDSLKLVIFNNNNPQPQSIKVGSKGDFTYSQKLTKPEFAQLYFNQSNIILLILSPGEKIKLQADYNNFGLNYTVTGSAESEQWLKNVNETQAYTHAVQAKKAEMDSLEQVRMKYIVSFIEQNPTSLTTLGLINMVNIDEHPDVYENLVKQLNAAYPDNFLVQDFYKQVAARFFLKEGSEIPDITLADRNGKNISLSSLRGKVVLVDFWASWCGPCRAEIPNIKQAYTRFHDKGFDVYSVSIDKTKDAWLQALDVINMPWANVFDATQEYAAMFGVSSIPFTLLIDQNGKIIARNVRGAALEQYLGQLLK